MQNKTGTKLGSLFQLILCIGISVAITGCNIFEPEETFSLSGEIKDLAGADLILQNGSEQVKISGDGIGKDKSFSFSAKFRSGDTYDVTIFGQPVGPNQTCTISNGNGTFGNSDVNNIIVTCVDDILTFSIGGSVSNLEGTGLALKNEAGQEVEISGNGPFSFNEEFDDGSNYNISVLTQPTSPDQICTIQNGSGTVNSADVDNIIVDCTTEVATFSIGGNVANLEGIGLELKDEAGDATKAIVSSGSFFFDQEFAEGQSYNITISSAPINPSQFCTIQNGSGTVSGNVTNINVSCDTNKVQLSWDANQEEDLFGYNIYFGSTIDLGEQKLFVNKSVNEFIHTPSNHGDNYYAISAVDNSGNESVVSEAVRVFISSGVGSTGSGIE